MTEVTYPYTKFLDNTDTFYGGGGQTKIFTFPDAVNDVSLIDFTQMKTSNGSSVSIRNITKRFNGGFSIRVYDNEDNLIGESYIALNKLITKYIYELDKITLPAGSNVKKIVFLANRKNANIVVNHDETSEFLMTVNRDTLFQPIVKENKPTMAELSWGANLTGTKYRIIQRVENAYRKIADESDIILIENVTGSAITLSNLSPGEEYVLVLQTLGEEWYDIGQVIFENEFINVEIKIEDVGSTYMRLSWNDNSDFDLTYKVILTSPNDTTKSVVTSENNITITDLIPDVEYQVQISLI